MLYDVVGGASPKPRIKTEYYDDATSTYVAFDSGDVEARSIELSLENKRYQSYSFMPPTKEMSLRLNNFQQIYSTGSGNAKASILKKNLLVRCWSGYELISGLGNESSVSDDFASTATFYHSVKSGSNVVLDISDYTGATIATAAQIGGTAMGVITYGTLSLGYPAYYSKTFRFSADRDPTKLNVNVSSGNFSLRYRLNNTSTFSGVAWSDFQTLSAGANAITIPGEASDQYLQYLVRFNGSSWSNGDKINSAGYSYEDVVSLHKRGTFVIDEPNYADKVNVKGRDYLRKAFETEINMPDPTVTKTVQARLAEAFDRSNIPYSTADWDNIATTCEVANATIGEQLNNLSAWKVCDYLMDAINAGDEDIYFTFDENGNAIIKKIETDVEADWTIHFRYNIESVSKSFDSEQQLQRCTVMNKDITVNSEITLGNFTGTTAGTSLHLAYGTTALYVRYDDTNSVINSESGRTNTAIDFGVNSGAAYDINVYGCHPKNLGSGVIWAEAGNSDNIKNNNGSTYKRVNPFMDSSKALAFADYIVGRNADPKKVITLKEQVNPLLEIGIDNVLVFDRFSYTDDVYGVQSISESWNNPSMKETLKLRDRGFNLGAFIWSRNGYHPGINDLKWSTGLVWSQDLGPNATGDSTDYTRTKSVKFT
jgi:hypothetical protein